MRSRAPAELHEESGATVRPPSASRVEGKQSRGRTAWSLGSGGSGLGATLPNAGNRNFPYVASPSGRLAAHMNNGRLVVTNYAWTKKGQKVWVVGQTGRAHRSAIMGNAPAEWRGRDKTRYEVAYKYWTITVIVHKFKGIRVRNASEHGFTVSVEKQRIF